MTKNAWKHVSFSRPIARLKKAAVVVEVAIVLALVSVVDLDLHPVVARVGLVKMDLVRDLVKARHREVPVLDRPEDSVRLKVAVHRKPIVADEVDRDVVALRG